MPVGRFPMRRSWIMLAVIVAIAFAPLLVSFAAAAIAGASGCIVNEGCINPCPIAGRDWGAELQMAAIAFWYGLLTWLFGLLLGPAWLAVLLPHRRAWKRLA